MVTGHSVTLTLTDGMQGKGQVVAVREDALLLNVSSPVPGYEKGNGSAGYLTGTAIDNLEHRRHPDAFGAIWFLQGINVPPGSFMTGQIRWAVFGGIAVADLPVAGCRSASEK
jgi:hypothetical protein